MKLGVGDQHFIISYLAHNNIFDPKHIFRGNMAKQTVKVAMTLELRVYQLTQFVDVFTIQTYKGLISGDWIFFNCFPYLKRILTKSLKR